MRNNFLSNSLNKSLYIKAFVLVLSSLILTSNCYSQKRTKEEKKLYKKAKKALSNEQYSDAQEKYAKLLGLNSTNDLYNFETGLSYYFSDFERAKSITYFEAALENSKEDTIPELKYYLGRAYHINSQYSKSKTTLNEFITFIKKQTKPGQNLLKETEYRIHLNENGEKLKSEKDNNVKIKNLGTSINTLDREYAPVYKKSDDVLLFTSRRRNSKGKKAHDLLPYEDIYVAKKTGDDSWSLIDNNDELNKYLPNNFNTKKHDAGVIYSIDGNTLYTYKKDKLWKSTYNDNSWSELEALSSNINESQFNIPSITVTQNGKTMFFVATKKDGFGGKDIYKSVKNESDEWSDPEILGANINTEFDEDGPFLSEDGNTLYFSSKRHDGIGGYDIYKSELVNKEWSQPINMGIPFNSPVDDIYLVIEDNNEVGFFSSDREGGHGAMDIFGFDLSCPNIENTELRGIVYNKTNKVPLEGTLSLINTENGETINETKSLASNGKFLMVAPPEKSYKLTVDAIGFKSQTLDITIPKQCDFYPLFSEIAFEKIMKDGQDYQVITLKNSFFNAADAIAKAQKDGDIDTSSIINEVPLSHLSSDKDYTNDKLLMALTRTVDTSSTSLEYSIISDTIKIDKPDTSNLITFYQEFFGYNIKEVNVNHPDFIRLIESASALVQTNGNISIDIESSASRVPTKTFKTNINLASLRGDEAKEVILKSLKEKGITSEKVVINKINSIVSGPKYSGDFKNTDKYNKFQYVKITIK